MTFPYAGLVSPLRLHVEATSNKLYKITIQNEKQLEIRQ
jgi:hypothetical protein